MHMEGQINALKRNNFIISPHFDTTNLSHSWIVHKTDSYITITYIYIYKQTWSYLQIACERKQT